VIYTLIYIVMILYSEIHVIYLYSTNVINFNIKVIRLLLLWNPNHFQNGRCKC